jgi:lipopolysaccharide export system permease protein
MMVFDRYILRSLLANYLIALGVMMSLYMMLDLFFNIDEFTETTQSVWQTVADVGSYYGAHAFLYFAQLSGVITLFACMATLARMRKANELTAMLASGVSLYRVAVPVVAFGVVASLFWYVDVEVMIPSVSHRLARQHDDASGRQSRGIWFVNDGDHNLLSAISFVPATREIEHLLVMHRDPDGTITKVTEAKRAVWETVPGHRTGGVWRLEGGIEKVRVIAGSGVGPRERMEDTPVSVYESELDPDTIELRQSQQWLGFLSSARLTELADREPALEDRVRGVQHARFATPLVHVLLLFLGLPFFLSREPSNMTRDAGLCVIVCGLCFLLAFAGQNFVRPSSLSALPAWLPLIVFTPVGVVLIDRIRT